MGKPGNSKRVRPPERTEEYIDTEDRAYVDSELRPIAGKNWNNLSDEEKQVIYSYTKDPKDFQIANFEDDAAVYYKSMSGTLEKALSNPIGKNIVLHHGLEIKNLETMFGSSKIEDIQKIIDNGEIIVNKGFMSTGSAQKTGFWSRPAIIHLRTPKGAKGMYVEPISKYGSGAKSVHWDGKSKQNYFSGEFETILNRNTKMIPYEVKTDKKTGQINIYADVIA